MKEKLNFSVDAQLMNELGQNLVNKNYLALAELIKNSYDADALNLKIIMNNISTTSKNSEIIVEDDGSGMNFNQIREFWMKVATSNKKKNSVSPIFGRPRTGNKGVGRFACQRLGTVLELETVGISKEGTLEKTNVIFDWNEFKPGMDIEEVEFDYKKIENLNSKTKTKLIIRNLNDNWTLRDFNTLRREILSLSTAVETRRKNFKIDKGFNIEISCDEFIEEEFEDLYTTFMNSGWGLIEGKVDKNGIAKIELDAVLIGKKEKTLPLNFDLLNGVNFKINWLPWAIDNKSNATKFDYFKNPNILTKNLTEKAKEFAGIRVNFNQFRVYPYGSEKNDWLGLDYDRARSKTTVNEIFNDLVKNNETRIGLSSPSNRNLFGYVSIEGESIKNFNLKIDREGFEENSESFNQLKEFIRLSIDWMTIQFVFFKEELEKNIFENSQKELKKEINENLEKPQKKDIFKDFDSEVNDFIPENVKPAVKILKYSSNEINKEDKNLSKTLNVATNLLENKIAYQESQLNTLRHIGALNSLLLNFGHESRDLVFSLSSSASEIELLRKYLPNEKKELIDEICLNLNKTKERFMDQLDLFKVLSTKASNNKKQKYFIKNLIEDIIKSFNYFIKKYSIEIDISEVENSIKTNKVFKAEIYTVLINLFSNSIKSILASGNKKIKIVVKRDNSFLIINFYDTGVGLREEHFKKVFTPTYTDPENLIYNKLNELNDSALINFGSGTGLGLSITKDIVENNGGEIYFKKTNDQWKCNIEVKLK